MSRYGFLVVAVLFALAGVLFQRRAAGAAAGDVARKNANLAATLFYVASAIFVLAAVVVRSGV